MRFHFQKDRQAYVLGKMLIKAAFALVGHPISLSNIRYTAYHRPYVAGMMDFNITHAGGYVACAIAEQGRVGIDLEEVKEINLADFEGQFCTSELSAMYAAQDPKAVFFSYWTRKEAVVKAHGTGLNFPLKNLLTDSFVGQTGADEWHLVPFSIAPDYTGHVASDQINPLIHKKEMHF